MNAAKFFAAASCLLMLGVPASAADNTVSVMQVGAARPTGNNMSIIIQQGSQNYAESDQTGAANTDEIEQIGNRNSATVVQKGINGTVIDIQIGTGNKFSVTQTGFDPPPVILVQHR